MHTFLLVEVIFVLMCRFLYMPGLHLIRHDGSHHLVFIHCFPGFGMLNSFWFSFCVLVVDHVVFVSAHGLWMMTVWIRCAIIARTIYEINIMGTLMTCNLESYLFH
jgi:hypothetical protein